MIVKRYLMPWVPVLCVAFNLAVNLPAVGQTSEAVSLSRIIPDKACGPRCVEALLRLADEKPAYDVDAIYRLIGKPSRSPTNLRDLKVAAEGIGFAATGLKGTLNDLQNSDGYIILPVGKSNASGAVDNPLHFILVASVDSQYAVVINPQTLEPFRVSTSEIEQEWNGIAIVISGGKHSRLDSQLAATRLAHMPDTGKGSDQIKDFGHVISGTSLQHTFQVLDATAKGASARIVAKNCACVTASLQPDAQGAMVLQITLNVERPASQEAAVVVRVEPGGILKRYIVRAFGDNAFDISPKIAEIEAPFGGQIRYPVRIEYYTNAVGSVVFDRIETDVPHFKAGNATTEEFRKGGTRIVRVTVPLIYNAPEKSTASTAMSGEVKFIFTANNQVKAVPMRLNASIGSPPFRPIPEKVFLIASSSIEALQARIAIELPAEVQDDAIEVTPASALPVQIVKTKVSQSRYLVTLTMSSSSIALMDPGLTRSSVAITLKQKDRAYFVTVPVNIFRPATQPTKVE